MSINSEAPAELRWRTSRTCDGGACVGVARHGEFIIVGNTADPDAGLSKFTAQEWSAFLAGVKLGDFDDLV
jgi:predicted secreted Zn-dependent protease